MGRCEPNFTKTEGDILDPKVGFTHFLETGESIASIEDVVITNVSTEKDVTTDILNSSSIYGSSQVKVWVQNGSAGNTYKITVTVKSTVSPKELDHSVYMIVID